jgi:hypothetical protein
MPRRHVVVWQRSWRLPALRRTRTLPATGAAEASSINLGETATSKYGKTSVNAARAAGDAGTFFAAPTRAKILASFHIKKQCFLAC